MKLSILIPVYNERYLVAEIIGRVLAAPLPEDMARELIIVDDGSRDGTRDILQRLAAEHPDTIRYHPHEKNQGKGAAIRTAVGLATGDFCIFQDADLEYDPCDYARVLAPLLSGQADVVYGSRFLGAERRRVLYYRHAVGNRLLTAISNFFTDLNLSDMETCYKAFRTPLLKSIPIRCNGFGIEPELTAKIAKRRFRVYEVPISYDGRTYQEGKKITWKDGIRALLVMFKYWIIDDIYDEKTAHVLLSDIGQAHRFNRWMGKMLQPYVGHRVLEVGAGLGSLSVQFMPRERYIASEYDELNLEVLQAMAMRRPNMEAVHVDAQEAAHFQRYRESVDTVICLNVLEHIPRAKDALLNMHSVLTPGGRVIILVPQGRWLFGSLDKAAGHVKRYTRLELAALFKECGFEVETSFAFNRIGVPGWFLNGRVLGRVRIGKSQLKLYDSMVWLWRRIDRLLPWPGLSVIMVGRKLEQPQGPVLVGEPQALQRPSVPAARI